MQITLLLFYKLNIISLNHSNLERPFLITISGTFKLKKKDLVDEGYNPNRIGDKLYYLNEKSGYQLLTTEIYDQIQQGKVRF